MIICFFAGMTQTGPFYRHPSVNDTIYHSRADFMVHSHSTYVQVIKKTLFE